MHGRLAVVVDRVDVVAEFQQQLARADRLVLGPGLSSPGARDPTPAAAIRGVQCSAFGSRGSAPSLSERFMSGTSAVMAARRNGVAPARSRTRAPDSHPRAAR